MEMSHFSWAWRNGIPAGAVCFTPCHAAGDDAQFTVVPLMPETQARRDDFVGWVSEAQPDKRIFRRFAPQIYKRRDAPQR
ncbi:hypothetical protein AGMMS50256_28780 [Betaproteobacteria bacterium]|nr:hypothetical protein AGMMS50256_28780 [Betaproteobacteria bacterium]